mgnify:CR=1 FL=1
MNKKDKMKEALSDCLQILQIFAEYEKPSFDLGKPGIKIHLTKIVKKYKKLL